MIKREHIDRLPSSVRDSIATHIKQCADKALQARTEEALAYTLTADEKHRAAALVAQGEYDAFMVLYTVFK